MATRIAKARKAAAKAGQNVRKTVKAALAKQRRRRALKKAGKALKTAGKAAIVVGVAAGAAVAATRLRRRGK